MHKTEYILYNTEFSKDYPVEYKKLLNESLTKTINKIIKDCMFLNKYIDNGHEKCIHNLK